MAMKWRRKFFKEPARRKRRSKGASRRGEVSASKRTRGTMIRLSSAGPWFVPKDGAL